jgi:hypothetical protein
MAPHHGSRRVDLRGLVRWSDAKLVVSSQAAPVDDRQVEMAVPRWETWREGAITVTSTDSLLVASTYRTGERMVVVGADP